MPFNGTGFTHNYSSSSTDVVGYEEWRPVPEFEYYRVSSLGRIYSVPREKTSGGILKAAPGYNGYRTVSLYRNGRAVKWRVHILVLHTFTGPRPDGLQGRHLNDDRFDNRLENLAWGTPSENMDDKVRNGRHHQAGKSECYKGHLFNEENTQWIKSKGRVERRCKKCARDNRRRRNL